MQTVDLEVKVTHVIVSPPMARLRRYVTCAAERGVWCSVTARYSAVQYRHPDEATDYPSVIL